MADIGNLFNTCTELTTPGELFDRLVILKLKCDRIRGKENFDLAWYKFEKLRQAIEARDFSERMIFRECEPLLYELRQLHEKLWDAENYIRRVGDVLFSPATSARTAEEVCRDSPEAVYDMARTARTIYELNTRRHKICDQINKHYGFHSEPKDYGDG